VVSFVFLVSLLEEDCSPIKNLAEAQVWWLIPIISATWEAKIGRNVVRGQPRRKVSKTPS
jgi:hypothetical protein